MVATEPLIGAWGWAVEHRRPLVGVGHVGLVALAYAGAFLLRFDLDLTVRQLEMFLSTLPLLLFVRMATFYWFHLLEGMWRYVSMRDLVTIGKATTLGSLVFVAAVVLMYGHGFPRSVIVLEWGLCLGLVGGVRAGIRSLREARHRRRLRSGKHAVIVGAGDAGETLLREIERNPMLHYNVVAFVDDDPAKRGSRIHDVAIMGGLDDLRAVCEQVGAAEVLVAVPSATGEARRRIVLACRDAGLPFKTVPPMDDLLRGRARIDQLAEVRPEDVLGRDTVHLGGEPVRRDVEGKRILVTGAAGSIGSELCRQLLAFRPERLYLLDRAESGLYFLDLELASRGTGVGVVPIVGDVTDRFQVEEVMKTCAPDVIYHAAAYKHVPLMEGQPLEGIANNVFGTEVVAHAARRAGVRKFVLISTDKAVDPVGIMGMTKRVAEGVVQAVGGDRTAFAAVRFGNVLGSDGSVLPVFQWQIARGGPVTITDLEATRYFMLLSEAAQLVLQAGALARGGEVFVLDMGEPVKIAELASNLVRLSGLEPGRDIAIEVTGLRPGERLEEVLLTESEDVAPTANEKVWTARRREFDVGGFRSDLEALRRCVAERDRDAAVEQLAAMAASY